MATADEFVDLDLIPVPQRHERWEAVLSRTHLGMAVQIGAGPFRAAVRRRWIGDLALVDARCGACSGVRDEGLVRRTDERRVAVTLVRGGTEHVGLGMANLGLRPSEALIWDSAQPASFTVPKRLLKRTLVVPYPIWREAGGIRLTGGGVVMDSASPGARMLSGYLDLLSGSPTPPGAIDSARNLALDLLVAVARGGSIPVTEDADLYELMFWWIDRHLGQSITARTVADAHGVSERTVHRVFAASGETVAATVRAHRLARARQELETTAVSVTETAHRWGFTDASHFARAFRREYGCSPSDVRYDPFVGPARLAGNGRSRTAI